MSANASGSDEGCVPGVGGTSGAVRGFSQPGNAPGEAGPEKIRKPLTIPRHQRCATARQSPGVDLQRRQTRHRHQLAGLASPSSRPASPTAPPATSPRHGPSAEPDRGAGHRRPQPCFEEDIRSCAKALAKAKRARIHVFIGTSPIHREKGPAADDPGRSLRALGEHDPPGQSFQEDVEYSAMDNDAHGAGLPGPCAERLNRGGSDDDQPR